MRRLRTQMRLELKQLRRRVPTTSVFVTHDQVEAMTLGDRLVVMKDGFGSRWARRLSSTVILPTASWPASSARQL
jgi:ABC-type sugar transport system ATPase subunit